MNDSNHEWAYQEGPGVLWSRGSLVFLSNAPDAPSQAVRLENSAVFDISSALDLLLRGGIQSLGNMALASHDENGIIVLLRGDVRLSILRQNQSDEHFNGSGFVSWREMRFEQAQQLRIELASALQGAESKQFGLRNGSHHSDSVGFDHRSRSISGQANTMPIETLIGAATAEPIAEAPATNPAATPEAQSNSEPVLVLPDGKRIRLSEQVLLGRSPHLSRVAEPGQVQLVRISSASRSLSRNHAALTLKPGSIILSDVGSTNGTSVWNPQNGMQTLAPGESVELSEDCVIRLAGKIDLHLFINGEAN